MLVGVILLYIFFKRKKCLEWFDEGSLCITVYCNLTLQLLTDARCFVIAAL